MFGSCVRRAVPTQCASCDVLFVRIYDAVTGAKRLYGMGSAVGILPRTLHKPARTNFDAGVWCAEGAAGAAGESLVTIVVKVVVKCRGKWCDKFCENRVKK